MRATDWQPNVGTVVSCKRSWLRSHYPDPWLSLAGQSLYRTRLRYTVQGVTYERAIFTHNPIEVGQAVTVLYDPARPERILDPNQDIPWNDPRRWIAMAIGLGIAALLVWLENGRGRSF